MGHQSEDPLLKPVSLSYGTSSTIMHN